MAGNLRSPRKRALEIGTDKSKFHSDLPYDPAAGVPAEHSGGEYADGCTHPKPAPVLDPGKFIK